MKIYLSSTYEDLKDHRRTVFDALRQSGYQVSAMEDDVARDDRPVNAMLHPYHSITISVLDINCGNCRVNSIDMLVISYYLIYVILRGIDYSYNHYHILAIFLSNG